MALNSNKKTTKSDSLTMKLSVFSEKIKKTDSQLSVFPKKPPNQTVCNETVCISRKNQEKGLALFFREATHSIYLSYN